MRDMMSMFNLQSSLEALTNKVEALESAVKLLSNELTLTSATTKALARESLKRSHQEDDPPLEKCGNEEIEFLYKEREANKKLIEDRENTINCLEAEISYLQKENDLLKTEISKAKALQNLVDALKPVTDKIATTLQFNEKLKAIGVQGSLSKDEAVKKNIEEWSNRMKGLEF